MTADRDLGRRLATHFADEAPRLAPDWILPSALTTIESTKQRRGLAALGRYSPLSTYMKLAAAAVVIVAAGLTVWRLAPGVGGPPNPTAPVPTPISSPTSAPAAATPTPAPTTYVTPPLTGTFISPQYGYTLSYPAGWETHAATEIWRTGVLPEFGNPGADTVSDVKLRDHLFVGAGSQLLNGATLLDWQGAFLTSEGCGATAPVVVGGANGVIGQDCEIALVEAGGRGYIFGLWSSSDDPQLAALDTRALFQEVLATVQLTPAGAAK